MIWKLARIETYLKLSDFYIIWKPLMIRIQSGLILKIWPRGSKDICILVLKKMGFLRQGLRGNLHTWDGTKKIFCNFLGINTHNFVKNDPDLENKGLFDAKFHGNWHEKIFRSQSSDIWGLGPKN